MPRNHAWIAVESLAASEFRDCNDMQAIANAVAQSNLSAESVPGGTFARLGWFEDLKEWVKQVIEPLGLRLNSGFRQLNARPRFSLIRFETDGPAVWFKAVGEPNLREYSITLMLAGLASDFLPSLIAAHPKWNGWLAFEAEGNCLLKDENPGAWLRAAHDLAELQIASLGSGPKLLDAGARDLSLDTLRKSIAPFFRTVDDWIARNQPSPAPLTKHDVCEICAQIPRALNVLEEAGSPSVLGNLDVNPENLIISARKTVFLDWAEAFVGHPFLTFQYLVQHYRRACGQDVDLESRLVAHYLSPWRRLLSDMAIRQTMEVAPLAAIFAWTIASESWSDPVKLNDPPPSRYFLGLMRRMHREAHLLPERSAPCRD
jgi:hypothetical protein